MPKMKKMLTLLAIPLAQAAMVSAFAQTPAATSPSASPSRAEVKAGASAANADKVNQFQDNAGTFAGYRRNHAKGVCVAGYFDSNGQAQAYSMAQVFAPGRTPVVGRFAIPGSNP